MIDIRKLKELVRLMVQHDLMEIDLRDGKEQVTVRRGASGSAAPVVYAAPPTVHAAPHAAQTAPPAAGGTSPAAAPPAVKGADDGLIAIESPMVGTFYASPDPDSPPFLSMGDHVSPGKVVCLIEAMKIFNEIKSEVSGKVERLLVKNGEAVEFGQKLFLVRPE